MDNSKRAEKKDNPVKKANFLSYLLLCYTWDIFAKTNRQRIKSDKVRDSVVNEESAYLQDSPHKHVKDTFLKTDRRELTTDDIYEPLEADESEYLGNRLEKEWNVELEREKKLKLHSNEENKTKNYKPSLFKAIFRMFFWQNACLTLINVIQIFSNSTHPVVQGWLIDHFKFSNESFEKERKIALYEANLMLFIKLVAIISIHHGMRYSQILGMRARIACTSLLYRKTLRLNKSVTDKSAAGRVINLMSNDVSRFDSFFYCLNTIWLIPLQLIYVVILMWDYVGPLLLVGISFILLVGIPLNTVVTVTSKMLRSRIAKLTDKRVQLISELISGMQVIKMYAWEKPFEKIINDTRLAELKKIKIISYIRNLLFSCMAWMHRVTVFVVLVTFVLMGNSLSPGVSFDVVTLINILQISLIYYLPNALISIGETSISINRIEEFLLLDEKITSSAVSSKLSQNLANGKIPPIEEIEKISKFNDSNCAVPIEIIFDHVSANWIPGQLPPTLNELSFKVEAGSICAIAGPVGSGKTGILNLLLGELSLGAGTVILRPESDGQVNESWNSGFHVEIPNLKISYASQDAWLFSGTVRENILFGEHFDFVKYNEVIEVCALKQDFEQLSRGDMTVVGERGASLSGGQRARINLARAVYREADLYLLDDPLSAVDPRVARHLFERCIDGYLKSKTRILVTHQLQFLQQVNSIISLERGSFKCVDKNANLNPKMISFVEKVTSGDENHGNSTNADDDTENDIDNENTPLNAADSPEGKVNSPETMEEEFPRHGYFYLFKEYFKAGSTYCFLTFYGLVLILTIVVICATDYWLGYWTNIEDLRTNYMTRNNSDHIPKEDNTSDTHRQELLDTSVCIKIYSALIIACVTLCLLRNCLISKICITASKSLHKVMFYNLLLSPMSFFNNNKSGQILNRFSKDTGIIDELLSKNLMDMFQVFSTITAVIINVSIANPAMIVAILILAIIIYIGRNIYLNAAQKLKRIETSVKSPIFSHANTTLLGLTTIRSTGSESERRLIQEFDSYQNKHTGAWFLMIVTTTAFGLFVDSAMLILNGLIAYSFILFNSGNYSGGTVGLALSQSGFLILMVQYGAKVYVEVIGGMTSVERIVQYRNLPKERPMTSSIQLPQNWPDKGRIVMKNVSMRYAETIPYALKDLNLVIEAGWKVGIVGRTGAGKSSIITALFRLVSDYLEGEIVIDGIDTKYVGLPDLRARVSIIPQEPVLFSQTLRYNLDPWGHCEDSVLLEALREVELHDLSLDQQVANKGNNFSAGQKQLMCLARAIIRQNKILVLDEATSNIDTQTDAIIQSTIKRRFANCTVLTIAHRLNTIIDSDRVIVMDDGSVVEFGSPHELLENGGYFASSMVHQTGNSTSNKLKEQAQNFYDQKTA